MGALAARAVVGLVSAKFKPRMTLRPLTEGSARAHSAVMNDTVRDTKDCMRAAANLTKTRELPARVVVRSRQTWCVDRSSS
jgi:hypothetical protein